MLWNECVCVQVCIHMHTYMYTYAYIHTDYDRWCPTHILVTSLRKASIIFLLWRSALNNSFLIARLFLFKFYKINLALFLLTYAVYSSCQSCSINEECKNYLQIVISFQFYDLPMYKHIKRKQTNSPFYHPLTIQSSAMPSSKAVTQPFSLFQHLELSLTAWLTEQGPDSTHTAATPLIIKE